jgi:uncharacterized protein (DUF2235 family)
MLIGFSCNYTPGDEIYVFGFSRGAYTARSFVGLIKVCGILLRKFASKTDEAIALYKKRDKSDYYDEEAFTFRLSHSPYVVRSIGERERRNRINPTAHSALLQISYLGVWDTVGALGIPARYKLLAGLQGA